MPYIDAASRAEILRGRPPATAGELNFAITSLVDAFLGDNLCYARLNEAIGAMECAKHELYRRIAAPFEDRKLAQNGDVYGSSS